MFIPDTQKFSPGADTPLPNFPNQFIPQNGSLCVHITCKNTNNKRHKQIIGNHDLRNIFILKHNEPIEIEIPDYCNKTENFNFSITHAVPIENGHYCFANVFANEGNTNRNDFKKWANVSKNLVGKINQPGEYEIKINYLSHINPFGTVTAYQAN
uniref:Uncharacterized protein n=1 Tax=Meloidogyne enterolobii TaxID=390850 RepID=A0A6V7VAA1_MELEN|nr:unnamed protein product [Meloidogyne enterolobii]